MNVKFGIIGCGNISTTFGNAIKEVENASLVAVASSNEERAKSFAEKYDVKSVYTDYDDIINDKNVDIIYIGLINSLHFDIAKRCLNSGKNVICEKPLTITLKETTELIELAKQKNVLFMEAMWTRCLPAYKKAKSWVTNGNIGKTKLIEAEFCINVKFDINDRVYNEAMGGGALYDVGIYPIDFITGILDKHPTSLNSMAHIGITGVDEYSVITMQFDTGEIAIATSGISVSAPIDARIYGDAGHIIVKNFCGARDCFLYDNNNNLLEEFHDEIENGFVHEIRHCTELFLDGKKESNLIPFSDTIYSAKLFSELIPQWKLKKI